MKKATVAMKRATVAKIIAANEEAFWSNVGAVEALTLTLTLTESRSAWFKSKIDSSNLNLINITRSLIKKEFL